MKTFNDLLALPIESTHNDITWLADSYYIHYHILPFKHCYEIETYEFYTSKFIDEEFVSKQNRIKIKVLKDFNFDGRRIWRLFYVEFDNVPVMFCRNAGREGDDSFDNVIINTKIYKQMHNYIFGNMKIHFRKDKIVESNSNANSFIDFYGHNLLSSEFLKDN